LIRTSSHFSRFLRLGLGQRIAWDKVSVTTGRRSLDHAKPLMASRKKKCRKCSFFGRGYGEFARHSAAGNPLRMGPASSGIIKEVHSRNFPQLCTTVGAGQHLTNVRGLRRGCRGTRDITLPPSPPVYDFPFEMAHIRVHACMSLWHMSGGKHMHVPPYVHADGTPF